MKSFGLPVRFGPNRVGGGPAGPILPAVYPATDRPQKVLFAVLSVAVILYSFAVLWVVARTGDVGLRCVFGRIVQLDVPAGYDWTDARGGTLRPVQGDILIRVGDRPIEHYTDVIYAQRSLSRMVGRRVDVAWLDGKGVRREAQATVGYRPTASYAWSVAWFLQELLIFAVGARVYWKRPRDESARLFFWLCIVTVGAYMGGYHWTEIVVSAGLIYPFAAFALFVPVVSLHFYLVFPRANPTFAAHRKLALRALYGVPTVYLAMLWSSMLISRWLRDRPGPTVQLAIDWVRNLALGYVGLAAAVFGLCLPCLIWSYRAARNRAERNQAKYILVATAASSPLIGFLLARAVQNPASLGLDDAAWPMFVVSLLYTSAYAMSITRYKLMQAEEIINRSAVYFAASVAAGLLYSGILVASTLVVGRNLQANKYSREALMVGGTAIVILVLSGAARERFQKAIDRRFYREKYKLDQAMRKMSAAVESLVDRETLGRRLLEAAAEVLHLEWGAIYLRTEPGGPFHLAAWHDVEPDERTLAPEGPLVDRLRLQATVRVPHAMTLAGGPDPATDVMIGLGGEVAAALQADGDLAGLIVLGPKRSGLPYEDEEIAFLGALGSVATLALHSAGIQQTLEGLDRELRDKVTKIAEQQRRILILQDQLSDRSDKAELAGGADRAATPEPRDSAAAIPAFERIRGSGPAARRMIEVARKVAASPSTVLIRGESGTGKELLAEAIHAASPRVAGPFVKVHCAALSQNLLESELFGHVKGAFTGADRDRVGRFEQAHGGTLLLDEIGDVSWETQTKLLRVLQQKEFERVGSSQSIAVDVRIVAATHQDLEGLIRAGRFREDLYYRLNVFSLRAPALRERPEDIFELAVHFLGVHARRAGKAVSHLNDDAVETLIAYDWPGNVRELENAIERAVVLSEGAALTRADLPAEIRRPAGRRRARATPAPMPALAGPNPSPIRALPPPQAWDESGPDPEPDNAGGGVGWDADLVAYERRRLVDALDEARGNKSEAARLLSLPRSTFFSKLRKHDLA